MLIYQYTNENEQPIRGVTLKINGKVLCNLSGLQPGGAIAVSSENSTGRQEVQMTWIEGDAAFEATVTEPEK